MLLKLIVWGVLIYLIYRAARTWISGPSRRSAMDHHHPEQVDDEMVKDPVCGVYFPRREAVVHRRDGDDLLFCSTACRDRYLAESRSGS